MLLTRVQSKSLSHGSKSSEYRFLQSANSNAMVDRDLSLDFSHFRLVPETRPCVQHSMKRHLSIPSLELHCRGFGITRIIRHVPPGAHSCCISGYNQAMFATEYVGFVVRMRKCNVCKAGQESYVSNKSDKFRQWANSQAGRGV